VAQPSQTESPRNLRNAACWSTPARRGLAAARATPPVTSRLRAHLDQEHEAVREGRGQRPLMLSANFHVEVSQIASSRFCDEVIADLVTRSSLIIALYSGCAARPPICASHAHHPLVAPSARTSPIWRPS